MSTAIQLKDVNELFKVKVEHKIYSFYTNTIPDYIKIGDTYRQVAIRLKEWKRVYKQLKPDQIFDANINDEAFFRDLAVHQYLRQDKHKHIVTPEEVDGITAFCTELFREDDVNSEDIKDAITDIKSNYGKADSKYVYYKLQGKEKTDGRAKWTENYAMRPNQKETVNNFLKAVEAGRNNLLMYAVMRFGKSFTAMQCAKAYAQTHDLKVIVITSAKKDVEIEWKNTINSHNDFKDFVFLSDDDLAENYAKISEINNEGKVAVVFLTLQVLNKKHREDRHKQVFESDIDILLIDETHYGVRAEKLGKVVASDDRAEEEKTWKTNAKAAREVKDTLRAKVNIHLSGTPYNILKSEEFSEEDIIAFCQFSDIAKEKEAWQAQLESGAAELTHKEVWDNPYFGFPQMIRFAFNITDESRAYLDAMSDDGMEYFAGVFKTESDNKEDAGHQKFVNESDVLQLFKMIDGSQEGAEMLGFLEYEGIKAAQLCRHIVCVMPRCTSCDALEKLLKDHAKEFKNLGEYEIINISGLDSRYGKGNFVGKVKAKIAECEKRNQKTISLTVNKMLTGTTVKEWDSMFYFKDTQSPQEYDQSIFRTQSPYVEKSIGVKDGKEYEIKIDKKPQTLLVDFKPDRMLYMQAYNIDKLAQINHGVEDIDFAEAARSGLTISPIICLNKDKLQKIDEATIVDAITNYTKDRSVIDETADAMISEAFLSDENIKNMLRRYPQLDAKTGIKHDPNQKGAPKDLDKPQGDNQSEEERGAGDRDNNTASTNGTKETPEDQMSALRKQLNACVARLLFYVFISGENLKNIRDVIESLDRNDRNKRIAANFAVNKEDLNLLDTLAKGNDKISIVKAIVKMSTLANEKKLSPVERAQTAIKKFNRFSSAEIVTPNHICNDMLNGIGVEKLAEIVNRGDKILDIASKAGEFAFSAYYLLKGKVDETKLKNALYSIPTSHEAYELTRYLYETLGLNVSNIAEKFVAFDLLEVKKDNQIDYETIKLLLTQDKEFSQIILQEDVKKGDKTVKFDAVVGNPPYQEKDGGAQASSRPIYNLFVNIAKSIDSKYISIIMPARWYAGGKGLDDFRNEMLNNKHIVELHDYLHPEEVFPNTNNRGGICYFLMDSNYNNVKNGTKVFTYKGQGVVSFSKRSLKIKDIDIFLRYKEAISILEKVTKKSPNFISQGISPRKPFGIESQIIKTSQYKSSTIDLKSPIKCYGKNKRIGYVESDLIPCNVDWIQKWKIFLPRANNIGTELNDDNLNAFVGEPNSICTEAYLFFGIKNDFNQEEANNSVKYFHTRFVRFLHGLAKSSHDATSKTYRFIPMQDFTENSDIDWSKSVAEIDRKLYKKYNLSDEEIAFIESMIKPME